MTSMREHRNGRRPRTRASRGPSGTKLGVLAAIFGGLLLVGGVLYWKSRAIHIPTHPETLCPSDRPPAELLVLLLDLSDGYTEAQRLQISNELVRIQQSVIQFGRIEVYAVDRVGERLTRPVIQRCNPGTEQDVNAIYQNPRLAKERWQAFSESLSAELERLMGTGRSTTSPIFEAIQASALRTFNRAEFDGIPRRLVIVSDLLQHMPGRLSQYQDHVTFDEFSRSAYFSDVRADLSGTGVVILYLVRPGTPQDPKHLQFWERYFDALGASISEVVPIYGAH